MVSISQNISEHISAHISEHLRISQNISQTISEHLRTYLRLSQTIPEHLRTSQNISARQGGRGGSARCLSARRRTDEQPRAPAGEREHRSAGDDQRVLEVLQGDNSQTRLVPLHLSIEVPYFSNSLHKNEKVTALTPSSPTEPAGRPELQNSGHTRSVMNHRGAPEVL
eukprot:SAG31_NODE_187_length_20848_cov_22.521953_26_plen_168_part_00